MNILLLFLFVMLTINVKAQFPFEIYPKIKYDCYAIERGSSETDSTFLAFSNFTDNKKHINYRIELRESSETDSSNIFVYANDILIQKIIVDNYFSPFLLTDTLFVGDINNDELIDIKLFCWNSGCGLAGSLVKKIYLIGRPDGKFNKFSFMDFSNETERDFNKDKNYEIIGIEHTAYENHSYWVYDLYSIKNYNFINVSEEFNYPILIQHLYRDNYSITNKVSRLKMKEFSNPKPRWYDERK